MLSNDSGLVGATIKATQTPEGPSQPQSVPGFERLVEAIHSVERRLGSLEQLVVGIRSAVEERQAEKGREWYNTAEAAKILGKSDFTVREKWCNQGRIECEKDEESGKWRIPAAEIRRLRDGGGLRPPKPR